MGGVDEPGAVISTQLYLLDPHLLLHHHWMRMPMPYHPHSQHRDAPMLLQERTISHWIIDLRAKQRQVIEVR